MNNRPLSLLLVWLWISSAPTQAAASPVRVRLWSQHDLASVELFPDPAFEVRACNSCAPLKKDHLRPVANGAVIEVDNAKFARLFVAGNYRVQVEGRTVRLSSPAEIKAKNGSLLLTTQLPLEDYVAGVVAGEAGGIRSTEALKAMAVAVRTFAVHFNSRHAQEGFDFCDSTHCQDLRLSAVANRVRAAVAATEGELLWHEGATIASYYHQDCGGKTEHGTEDLSPDGHKLPYLAQLNDPWCVRNPQRLWRAEIRKSDLSSALIQSGVRAPKRLKAITVLTRSSSGRVLSLRLTGEFSTAVSQDVFYTAVGRALGWNRIRSGLYEVSDSSDQVAFVGRGGGHGVGLCQLGAEMMGQSGRDYRHILAFYYPGTHVGMNAQGLRWNRVGSAQVELLSTRPEVDKLLIPRAERALREAEERTGMIVSSAVTIRVYPTVAAFRDATGEPGWVAASTRGNTVRLQPMEILQKTQGLDGTLRHEILHVLLESHSRSDAPLWLREGLVLCLNGEHLGASSPPLSGDEIERMLRSSNPQELRTAYAAAERRVDSLMKKHGKAAVIDWLNNGLPSELRSANPPASRR